MGEFLRFQITKYICSSFFGYTSLPRSLFPVGLPVKIFKALLPPTILTTCPGHHNLLDLIILTMLGEL